MTSIGTTYTATYDLAGNMTCRAPTSATTCAGTQTGAQLRYDAEERLATWQNAPSNPTTTAAYLYDGSGQRVAQSVTTSGTTITTAYLGNYEEVATSGSSTTTTTYYYAAGQRIALAVNGVFSYLATDGLGSVNAAFDANGSPVASALFRPYGSLRYSSGAMPGSLGFTGQHSDAAVTGLDYYNARYYDPAAGAFATADMLSLDAKGAGGSKTRNVLGRYAYVLGNPETDTDPSGRIMCESDGNGPCDSSGDGGNTPDNFACNQAFCSARQLQTGVKKIACGGGAQTCSTLDPVDNQAAAHQKAKDSAHFFGQLGLFLGFLAGALAAFSAILFAQGNIVWGAFVLGLGLQIGAWAVTAALIAGEFSNLDNEVEITQTDIQAAMHNVFLWTSATTVVDIGAVGGAFIKFASITDPKIRQATLAFGITSPLVTMDFLFGAMAQGAFRVMSNEVL